MRVVILWFLFLAACGGCGARMAEVSVPKMPPERVVEIHTACLDQMGNQIKEDGGSGTGVVLDRRHVLTALHVIRCESPRAEVVVTVAVVGKVLVQVEPDRTDLIDDVVRLRVVDGASALLPNVSPVQLGVALDGDFVCFSPAIPKREPQCGFVVRHDGDHVYITAATTFGNSGSGLFDRKGRLVGILTNLWTSGGAGVGGRAVSMARRSWMVRL